MLPSGIGNFCGHHNMGRKGIASKLLGGNGKITKQPVIGLTIYLFIGMADKLIKAKEQDPRQFLTSARSRLPQFENTPIFVVNAKRRNR
ncbi:MAG: hypothetical protein ACJA0I_001274 [Gammaproteobacteria bacterium]|jgi:hypothetical protein